MKTLKPAILALVLGVSAQAGATTVSFDLNPGDYTQDSPVATDLFAGSGLVLSNGVVTACGGECISSPAAEYTGSITGNFMGNAYGSLEFIGVTGNATIDLFDLSNSLIATLNNSSTVFMPDFEGGFTAPVYSYVGAIGIASWTVNLAYDGLIQMTFDNQTNNVPEPSIALLASLALFGLGAVRRRSA